MKTSKVTIKIESESNKFKPITATLKIEINSPEDLKDLKELVNYLPETLDPENEPEIITDLFENLYAICEELNIDY